MKREMSLTVANSSIFRNLFGFFRRFFDKSSIKKEEIENKESDINDFECLKLITEGEISVKDLGNDQKMRLISLCDERKEVINIKIKEVNEKIQKMTNMLNKINTAEK